SSGNYNQGSRVTHSAQPWIATKDVTTGQEPGVHASWVTTTNCTVMGGSSYVVSGFVAPTLIVATLVGTDWKIHARALTSNQATITEGGTTGDRTINRPAGTVNIAAAGSSVVVTNSLVTANSLVQAWLRTNDST